ncbi:hypothetical protein KUV62_11120 [Salipiger bermudensis]|uniref:hypothetical protein n=1 Tax=Salipiger bermudensis TaxID=344736 RepID=UPI001C9A1932|nr:hypothetical protein [Salipiger bermudensis]MBY6004463.1 hypothetical protein [Salipiger bermudensis]
MTHRILPATTLLAGLCTALPADAQGVVEEALGGPVIICTGAVTWTEGEAASELQVEPLRLAVRESRDAAEIALFLSAEDFVAEDVWTCKDGICMSSAAAGPNATLNVMQLEPFLELPDGEAIYRMEAVFMVVSANESPMTTEGAHGQGAFFCEKPLPSGLVAAER